MLARSLVALLLSLPASIALLGAFLAVMPSSTAITLPTLLMALPVWVGLACASYLATRAWTAAIALLAITGAGFGLIAVLKYAGVAGL